MGVTEEDNLGDAQGDGHRSHLPLGGVAATIEVAEGEEEIVAVGSNGGGSVAEIMRSPLRQRRGQGGGLILPRGSLRNRASVLDGEGCGK